MDTEISEKITNIIFFRGTLIKDCATDGPTVCNTEYISECETTQHEHQVHISLL